MRITCLITICAYLSSTVSTDEIQHLNRLRKIKSQDDLVRGNVTTKKELISDTETRPDVPSTLRESRRQGQIETSQKPYQKSIHKSHFSPQQKQHPRDRSKRPIKRVKTRSVTGSTYEVDNEVHEIIHESVPDVHDEGPIYIKPLVRVTKKNIFDSIIDVLHQLLEPPRKELGPIVGPIKLPGSKRKIYIRLMEPVDSSHISVRFVTQVPVPVVDEESLLGGHESTLSYVSHIDPHIVGSSNRHPIISGDAAYSSSNHHHSIQLLRNASHVPAKGQRSPFKLTTKLKRPAKGSKETSKENVSSVKVEAASETESDKTSLYPSEEEAVKQVAEIINNATKTEQDPKNPLEPWYQLTTHHLPLRQVAPLYPLSSMEHTESNSYENTYKAPSESLTVPNSHSSSYQQYGSNNAGASGYYDQSSYTIPNIYTYQQQNEFSNSPSSYPISYQNQNEFNNIPSSTSYVKQNDLFSAPTAHVNSHEKPANVLPSSGSYAISQDVQNSVQAVSSSQNVLRIIDPPLYFLDPRKPLKNPPPKIFERQQPYNLPDVNENDTSLYNNAHNNHFPIDPQGTWSKVKREKSESTFQKSTEITGDDGREKWQPLMFVPENADWPETFANLAKVINGDRQEQPVDHPRQDSRNTILNPIETSRVIQRQRHRNRSTSPARAPECSPSEKGNKCERTRVTTASTLHPKTTVKIVEKQTEATTNSEVIVITPKSNVTSKTMETSKSSITTTTSDWIEEPQSLMMTTETPTTSTTKKPPLLIKVIGNTIEKSMENKTTGETMSNAIEKSAANNTTEKSVINSTLKISTPRNNTMKNLYLPKRPMIMKKPMFVLKELESGTTKRAMTSRATRKMMFSSTTQKSTTSSTTEKMKTRRSKFQPSISKTKSNST